MKPLLLLSALIGAVLLTPARAQTNVAPAASTEAPSAPDKHVKPILAALQLADAAKTARVQAILAAQLQVLRAWHAENDGQIKPLWNEFNQARSAQNVTNASAALAKIDARYLTFQPHHDQFLKDLAAELSPAQVETVKDVLTVNKVKVTYDVYLQIFPTLTEAQKAVVLQDLKDAREQAIDCEAMTEKSAFFKKYKILIEDNYLTAQGYNPKQARKDFAASQKTVAKPEAKPAPGE